MATLLLLLALAGDARAPECIPQFAPLHTGSSSARSHLPLWHYEQAASWGGDDWLGWNARGDTLEPVTLVVERLVGSGQSDHDEVTVESIPAVTYAVRCMPGLEAGPITTAGILNASLQPGRPLRVSLASRQYAIRLDSSREDLTDARVILTDGERTQVLYAVEGFVDEPHFYVEWAGDLDGDGRLDLVVNLSYKYSWHPHRLLLSSKAAEGEQVGEAGVFESGC